MTYSVYKGWLAGPVNLFFFSQTRSTLYFLLFVEWHECAGRAVWLRDNQFQKRKKRKNIFPAEFGKPIRLPSKDMMRWLPSIFFFSLSLRTQTDQKATHTELLWELSRWIFYFFSFPLSHGERALLHEKSQKRRWVSSSSAGPPPQGGMYICFFFLFNSAMAPNASQFRRAEINWTARESDWRISFVHLA